MMFSLFKRKKRNELLEGAKKYVASKYRLSVDSLQSPPPKFSREPTIRYSLSEVDVTPKDQDTSVPETTPDVQFSLKRPSEVRYSLKDNYSEKSVNAFMQNLSSSSAFSKTNDLDDSIDMSFVDKMLEHINRKQLRDSTVYKAANVDRRLFSKIVSDRSYKPAKDTCIAFALALQLSLEDTSDLLSRAGYTLSHSSKRDVIIEYFIREHVYNLNDINDVLYRLDQKVLGR